MMKKVCVQEKQHELQIPPFLPVFSFREILCKPSATVLFHLEGFNENMKSNMTDKKKPRRSIAEQNIA